MHTATDSACILGESTSIVHGILGPYALNRDRFAMAVWIPNNFLHEDG